MSKNILDPNPFKKPFVAKKGGTRARDIYTEVGLALDRWEHCCVSFATIYSALVKPEGPNHVLMWAFGTITSPATIREMIQNAGKAFFENNKNGDLEKEIRVLLKLFHTAMERRNDIAHATVMGDTSHKIVDNKAIPLPTVWFLVPPLFATRKKELNMRGPKYKYSTREISHFTACFEELGSRADKLGQAIRVFYAALQKKDG